MLTSAKEVRTENTYESTTGYLASTSHNTTNAGGNVVYNFDYDGLGRQTGVSVGSAVLSETSYHPQRRNRGRFYVLTKKQRMTYK